MERLSYRELTSMVKPELMHVCNCYYPARPIHNVEKGG
jgi:hypothetical protein